MTARTSDVVAVGVSAAGVSGVGRVRVLVWHRAPAGGPDGPGDAAAIERAFRAINAELAGTAGLLASELLRSPLDPSSLVVASEWQSLELFLAWERSDAHRPATAPLREFRDPLRVPAYEILEVVDRA
jgi:heme-degrading monooxygenase HmoA